jgi:hypothetical protein
VKRYRQDHGLVGNPHLAPRNFEGEGVEGLEHRWHLELVTEHGGKGPGQIDLAELTVDLVGDGLISERQNASKLCLVDL